MNLNGKNIILLSFWAMVCYKIWAVLNGIHFQITDHDQALQWWACNEMSNGNFYTPFFYSTSYGSSLEAFLAIPFYKLGIPVYKALPLTISAAFILLLLPLSFKMAKLKGYSFSIILVTLFLSLPVDYYTLLLAAKGHTTGIILGLLAVNLLWSSKNWSYILAGFCIGFSVHLNPNVLLLYGLLIFIPGIEKWLKYVIPTAIAAYGLYAFGLWQFWQSHSKEHLHNQWSISFDIATWMEQLQDLDKYLNITMPVFGSLGFISLLFPFLVAFYLRKTWPKWRLGLLLLFAFGLLFSFGINKTTDGTPDLLFHHSRFYLALGVVNVFMLATWLRKAMKKTFQYKWLVGPAALIICAVSLYGFEGKINSSLTKCGTSGIVNRVEIETMLNRSEAMKQIDKGNFYITGDFTFYTELLYLKSKGLNNVYFHSTKQFDWLENELGGVSNASVYIFLDAARHQNDKRLVQDKASKLHYRLIHNCPQFLECAKPYY